MTHHRSISCIVPPHILQNLLESKDEEIRQAALATLMATTRLRAERQIVAQFGFMRSIAGTRRRTIYDCRNGRVLEEARLARGEGDEKVQDGSVNRAYDGLGTTYNFYKEVFDRNSIDDNGMRLDGYVHFGRSYNNAFWNGRQMVFGDGDGRLFIDFTRSVDVIGHELAHGVTEFTANLQYHNQPGALNESMSDVFGSLVKQWSLGQTAEEADWLIGSDVFSPAVAGDALRSMKDPGNAYDDPNLGRDPQPKHMDNFMQLPDTDEGDFGGVHINSGIPNHAFYLAATFIGGHAWEAAGHIWYEALKASTETTEFQAFADTTSDAAGRLYGVNSAEQQAVQAAWKDVGIRISVPAPAPAAVRRVARAKEADGQAALMAKLNELASQVKELSGEVAELRATAVVGRAQQLHE